MARRARPAPKPLEQPVINHTDMAGTEVDNGVMLLRLSVLSFVLASEILDLFIPHSDIMKQGHNMVIELQTPSSAFRL